jgi:hypothetical protein
MGRASTSVWTDGFSHLLASAGNSAAAAALAAAAAKGEGPPPAGQEHLHPMTQHMPLGSELGALPMAGGHKPGRVQLSAPTGYRGGWPLPPAAARLRACQLSAARRPACLPAFPSACLSCPPGGAGGAKRPPKNANKNKRLFSGEAGALTNGQRVKYMAGGASGWLLPLLPLG